MPLLKHGNIDLHYEQSGSGPPLILIHGFSVNTAYWTRTGVMDTLAERYRAIVLDMRGHGRTRVAGEPRGFDADTLSGDVETLANGLGLGRFHLLGHSAGGMVAVRYAMRDSGRLSSLILLGTASATAFGEGDPRLRRQGLEIFAQLYERYDWDPLFMHLRYIPGPLLYHMNHHPESDRLWHMLEGICRLNDPKLLANFARSFFTDPDPRVERLKRISCPTLVLVGEQDKLFIKPSALLARHIPNAHHVVMRRIGHMTALEAPERTGREVLDFLDHLPPASLE
jgi:pimeloyl-ACP methyl ester carboxylesterase